MKYSTIKRYPTMGDAWADGADAMDVLAATVRQLELRSRPPLAETRLAAACTRDVTFAADAARAGREPLVERPARRARCTPTHDRPGDLVTFGIALVIAFWRLGHHARRRPFWQDFVDLLAVVLTMAVIVASGGRSKRLWLRHSASSRTAPRVAPCVF